MNHSSLSQKLPLLCAFGAILVSCNGNHPAIQCGSLLALGIIGGLAILFVLTTNGQGLLGLLLGALVFYLCYLGATHISGIAAKIIDRVVEIGGFIALILFLVR